MKENKIGIGNSGEYFVAAELERRGFSVAVPMSNVKDFDLLIFDRETHKQFAIQVKTTQKSNPKWPLTVKNEELVGENIIYIFVLLNGLNLPSYYIVPSEVVANQISEEYRNWLNTPGKDGKKHKDTTIRTFSDFENKYLDNWDFLK